LDLESKGASSDPDIEKVSTWFSHPKRKVKDNKILLRHWASLEDMTDSPNAIGLDAGCVWGGTMSLYCLETQHWQRCQCENRKCKK